MVEDGFHYFVDLILVVEESPAQLAVLDEVFKGQLVNLVVLFEQVANYVEVNGLEFVGGDLAQHH